MEENGKKPACLKTIRTFATIIASNRSSNLLPHQLIIIIGWMDGQLGEWNGANKCAANERGSEEGHGGRQIGKVDMDEMGKQKCRSRAGQMTVGALLPQGQ